jgi:hypothetical protein
MDGKDGHAMDASVEEKRRKEKRASHFLPGLKRKTPGPPRVLFFLIASPFDYQL